MPGYNPQPAYWGKPPGLDPMMGQYPSMIYPTYQPQGPPSDLDSISYPSEPPMKPFEKPYEMPYEKPYEMPVEKPYEKPLVDGNPMMKPMKKPVITQGRPVVPFPMPTAKPGDLVPLIDKETGDKSSASSEKKPGDVARRKCLEYERYAPTVRYGPDKDCVPNHTYPIGGNPGLPKEFPHFAQLGTGPREDIQWFCGGSLISDTWVLTAAHCVFSGDRQVQWVRLGDPEPDSDEDDAFPQTLRVVEAIKHPDYKVLQVYNDIALLRLERAPNMTTLHVRPACLQVDRELEKDKLNLIGFGLTEENGEPARALMEVSIYRTPGDKCAKFFDGAVNLRQLPDGLLDDSQLCAGLDQVGKDACQGDSGGPLLTLYSPECMHHVAGVTSFGQGCGRGAPGVYTRVSNYVPWIESIVWPDE